MCCVSLNSGFHLILFGILALFEGLFAYVGDMWNVNSDESPSTVGSSFQLSIDRQMWWTLRKIGVVKARASEKDGKEAEVISAENS